MSYFFGEPFRFFYWFRLGKIESHNGRWIEEPPFIAEMPAWRLLGTEFGKRARTGSPYGPRKPRSSAILLIITTTEVSVERYQRDAYLTKTFVRASEVH